MTANKQSAIMSDPDVVRAGVDGPAPVGQQKLGRFREDAVDTERLYRGAGKTTDELRQSAGWPRFAPEIGGDITTDLAGEPSGGTPEKPREKGAQRQP